MPTTTLVITSATFSFFAYGGVRPAFYLNLSSLNLKGGAGTSGNPYIVGGSGSETRVEKNTKKSVMKWDYTPNKNYQELANMSMELSNKAYSGYNELQNYMTTSLNFKDVVSSETWGDDNRHNCSFAIGRKETSNGKDLVCVVIRGTDGAEWMGNMDFCGETYSKYEVEEYSFRQAANFLREKLSNYMSKSSYKNSMLLVTGHSRGGAIANLVAADYNKLNLFSEVYAYTFATPNTTLSPVAYSNIFNYCYADDFVPSLPLKEWGYGKYGITYEVPAEFAYKNDVNFKSDIDTLFKNRGKLAKKLESNNWFDYNARLLLTKSVKYAWNTPNLAYTRVLYTGIAFLPQIGPTMHTFMKDGLARFLVGGGKNIALGIVVVGNVVPLKEFSYPLFYFIGGSKIKEYVSYTHESETYLAGVYNGVFTNYSNISLNSFSLDSEEEIIPEEENCNSDEISKLREFINYEDNADVLGYDASDISTWSGVKWNQEGNVVAIDFSGYEIKGKLDVSEFAKLSEVNIEFSAISELVLEGCEKLNTLKCTGSRLENLDLSNCKLISVLELGTNAFESIDISDLSELTDFDCSNNNITNINFGSSSQFKNLNISGNYIDCEDESVINICEIINQNNGTAIVYPQKNAEDAFYSENELEKLATFANMDDNDEHINWNENNPSEFVGVEWEMHKGCMHVKSITIDDMPLVGNLDVKDFSYLERLSLNNSKVDKINVSGCTALTYLSCVNSNVTEINLDDCNLEVLYCDNNYISDTSEFSKISLFSAENQKPNLTLYDINADDKNAVLNLLGNDTCKILGWDASAAEKRSGIEWKIIDDEYRIVGIDLSDKNISGILDLSVFEKLEDFDMKLTDISEIKLPENITEIPDHAFYECGKLKSVVIPKKVAKIGANAFTHCESLEEICIPESVTSIDTEAFADCSSLKTILFVGDVPSITDSIFNKNTNAVTYALSTDTKWDDTQWEGELVLLEGNKSSMIENGFGEFSSLGKRYVVSSNKCNLHFYKAWYNENKLISVEMVKLTDIINESAQEALNIDTSLYDRVQCFVWDDNLVPKATWDVNLSIEISEVLESDHSYSSNLDETKTYTYDGNCESIDVTFSSDTETESGWDYIYILDANDNQIGKYSGTELAGKTINIPGNTVKIRLTSDGSVTRYGYRTESIVVNR